MDEKIGPAKYPASSGAEVAGSVPEPSFEEVWERIKRAVAVKNQSQLAAVLEIKTPSITGAKQRGIFPLAWAYKLAWTYNVSLDFLLFGVERGKQGVVHDSGGFSYSEPAVRIIDDAMEMTGVALSEKQKAAMLELVREELKITTVQMLRALKRGAGGEENP